MAHLVSSDLSSTILNPNVQGDIADLAFRKADYVEFLTREGRVKDGLGGSPYLWNVVSAVNASAETYSEGQAPPTAGQQTYKQASLSHVRVRAVYGFTKDVQVNAAKGGFYANQDPTSVERVLGESDVMYLLEQTLLGSNATAGIAAAVDNSGAYATLNASTTTQWASEENGSIGALTIAAMQTLYTEMISASGGSSVPRGAKPTHWLMPPNQMNNLIALGDGRATTGSVVRQVNAQGMDLGYFKPDMLAFNGLPVVKIPNITTTETYLVDVKDITLIVHKDIEVEEIVGNPETRQFQVSFWVAHKFAHRNWHGKMTGITA